MAGTAVMILRLHNLFVVVMLGGVYSLLASTVFVLFDAVDVAFTEASVGSGISTILFLAALSYLPKEEAQEKFSIKHIYAICTCTIVAGLLIWASYDLPLVGQLENPVHQHLAQDFIEGSRNHIGIPNVVTSILASYRGYDTFGETVVIYTAGIAVLVLLYDGVSKTSKINKEKK